MLATPHLSGNTHAALHFVEDEEDVVLIADFAQLLQPFASEIIIAAFTLDRLNDDGADVDLTLVEVSMDLLLRLFLARNHVLLALVFRQSKIDVRTGNARPIKLREQIGLPRIGV